MSNHDWRTKHRVYISSDTPLPNSENYEWSKPTGEDQHIITRGVARKGAELIVLNTLAVLADGDKTLELTIKEPDPTAIFLNESRLAWEKSRYILSEVVEEAIGETIQFSKDTSIFDFLQKSATAIIMAITGLECYANHKIRDLRESSGTTPVKKGKSTIEDKFNLQLPAMMDKEEPSVNLGIKDCWEKFKVIKETRNQLIHATAKRMQNMNISQPESFNTWRQTLQVSCPHNIAIRLIKYFEDEEPEWLKRFPEP